jgi:cytochrome c oxidase subunit 2
LATTGSIKEHIEIVYSGRAGTAMQGYGKQLSLKEIAAVVTYERNAWQNNTGDAVQASDVKLAVGAEESATTETSAAEQTVPVATETATESEDLTKVYTMEEMMKMGEEVYLASCAACHQPSGKGLPPAFPGLDGSAIATGDVAVHLDIVINGSKKNPAMAAYSPQLTDTQIAAVVTYERNAWTNKTGDLIQAADVSAASAK